MSEQPPTTGFGFQPHTVVAVDVDTLVQTIRDAFYGAVTVSPHALEFALSDLAARARLSDQRRREVLDLKPAATALVKDRDRLARRVAELERELERAEIDGAWRRDTTAMRDRALSAEALVAELKAALEWLRFAAGWEAFKPVRGTNEWRDFTARIDSALAGDGGGMKWAIGCPSGKHANDGRCRCKAGDGGGA